VPNRNYEKGRRAEYKVMKQLRKEGFQYVGRTAGSHGIFDVWGIELFDWDSPVHKGRIKLVQVKTGKTAERERAKTEIGKLTGSYFVEGVNA
jgi:hypothetical protein